MKYDTFSIHAVDKIKACLCVFGLKIQPMTKYGSSEQKLKSNLFAFLVIKFIRVNQEIALEHFSTRELNCFHARQNYLLDARHKLSVHQTFLRRPKHLLNVLGKVNLRPCPEGN